MIKQLSKGIVPSSKKNRFPWMRVVLQLGAIEVLANATYMVAVKVSSLARQKDPQDIKESVLED